MIWQDLKVELGRWQEAGRSLDVWLRDDDAIAPTEQLEHLLALCHRFQIPVLLAVIPGRADAALAARLAGEALVRPCQHGWMHTNHAPEGEKSAEFGGHRPLAAMLADLQAGHARFTALFPGGDSTCFVPPWNRISPELVARLPGAGLDRLSAFRPLTEAGVAGLRLISPDIDIIDWKAARTLRPAAGIAQEIVAHLGRWRMEGQGAARLGLLLHHLVQTADSWALLDSLLAVFARYSHVRFADPADF
jgi:hypothetical protein